MFALKQAETGTLVAEVKQTVVDAFTRMALAIDVDQGIKGDQVVAAHPRPFGWTMEPAFISKPFDGWAYENGGTLDVSRSGKPTDNAFVKSFDGRLRDDCLDAHGFLSLVDARAEIDASRRHCNESRHHASPGWLSRLELPP